MQMIRILDSRKKNFKKNFEKLILKRRKIDTKVNNVVNKIINDVKRRGDKALVHYERKFNNNSKLIPSKKSIAKAIRALNPKVKKAIFETYKRIYKWHSLQLRKNIIYKDNFGNKFSYITKPLASCAVYCPQNLPSSTLMNCIPPQLARVKRIVLCTPAINGQLNGAVMYAAKLCNVKEIVSLSGASAIAALGYGTKKIKPVDIITGPGSNYVAAAKRILSSENIISQERMFAGESEVVCWCDDSASSDEISYSLLAQSEHSQGCLAIMISKDLNLIKEVKNKIEKHIKTLPRKKIIAKSLKKYGCLIYVKSEKEALNLIQFISPEHIELSIRNYKKYINPLNDKLKNTGSIAAGPYSSMACSDYGIQQHSLPTHGTARYAGGLSVSDFTKQISINELSKIGLKKLSKSSYILANMEKLTAHSLSIKTKALRSK